MLLIRVPLLLMTIHLRPATVQVLLPLLLLTIHLRPATVPFLLVAAVVDLARQLLPEFFLVDNTVAVRVSHVPQRIVPRWG